MSELTTAGDPHDPGTPLPPAPPPTLDVKAAFTQLWQADAGKSAILIGGLMYLLFPLLIPPLIATGWLIAYGRTVSRGDSVLPPWKFRYSWDGLRLWFVGLVYALPIIALAVPFYLPFFLEIFEAAQTGSEPDQDLFFRMMTGQYAFVAISQLYNLALAAIRPAYNAAFILDDRVASCFRPSRLKAVIRPHGASYLLAPLLVFVAGIIGSLGFIACLVGIAFTIFYAGSIEFHLSGQLAGSAEREPSAATA